MAEAIADGLRTLADVVVVDVIDAPVPVPDGVDLVVLGGPTHAFSMSRESTRAEAVGRGGNQTDATMGIRDWLDRTPRTEHRFRFAAFDTRVHVPLLPGSAAKRATKIARKLGFDITEPESFRVLGYEGPIAPGELDHAAAWGADLAALVSADGDRSVN